VAKVQQDDSKEIKAMLQKLFQAVQGLKEAGVEQKRISKELMKVMSLLHSGFIDSAEDANKLIDAIKDNGFNMTDEFIKKWARARKVTDEDLKNIIKSFKKIDDLNDDIVESAKDYTDLLEDQIGSIEDTLDLSGKLLQSHKKITEAVTASKKQAAALAGGTGDVAKITDALIKKKVDMVGMFAGAFDGIDKGRELVLEMKSDIDSLITRAGNSEVEVRLKFNPLSNDLDSEVSKMMDSIDTERIKRLTGLRDYYAKNSELQDKVAKSIAAQDFTKDVTFDVDTSDITVAGKMLEKGTSEYQKVLETLTKTVSENGISKTVAANFEKMIGYMTTGVKLTDEQAAEMVKYKNQLGTANKMMVEQFDTRLKDLDLLKTSITFEKGRLAAIGNYTNNLSAAHKIVTKIGEGFDYISGLLPAGVSDFFGISKVSMSLLDAHAKGVEKFSKYVAEGGDLTKSMSVYMAEIGPSIRMALSPMLLMVAAGALLYSTLKTAVDTYKDMASSMKISIKQAKDLHTVDLDILTSQKNQFATMEDIQAVQSEMIESGKSLYMLNTKASKELAINLTDVGKAFGYGTAQATKLQNTFTNLGASDDLALNLQTNLGLMAEMAGLSPQIVGEDLIDAADEVATYFAGMPEQAAKAALGVRKMGMSLKQAGQIAQKMLDLEGFMTDMYELQAMTGGGIDFSGAFDKGLVGDIEGMTKDIMNEIGTTAEYNKMDYLTRTKIAKTLGMSADELGKSVRLNEQIAQFSGLEKDALEANKDRLGDITKMNKDQIRDRLQQLQSTDRLGVAWDKIKGTLLKALIPLAEAFAGAIDAISPIIDVIVIALKGVAGVVKMLVPLVKGILAPFQGIAHVLSGITSTVDDWLGAMKPIDTAVTVFGHKFDIVKDAIYGIGSAIGSWVLLFKFPAVMGSIVGVFKTILSFMPGVSTIFGSLTSGFGGVFGSMGKQAKYAAKEGTDPIVNMASKIETSMTGMIDRIKSSFDDMAAHMKTSMGNAKDAIAKSMSKSPVSKIMEEVSNSGAGTARVITGEAAKASKGMEKEIGTGVEKSKKKLKEVTEQSEGLISKSGIKDAFGTLVSTGTEALSTMAVKAVSSYIFAAKEGENKLSGMGGQLQGVFEMAATVGSALIAESFQSSIEKVFVSKIEKKLTGGFEKISGSAEKVFKDTFSKTAEEGTGMFGKIKTAGESVFGKLKGFGKSIFSKGEKSATDAVESVADKVDKTKGLAGETVEKVKDTEAIKKVTTPKVPEIEVPKVPEKGAQQTGSIFKGLADTIKTVWSTIKATVLDITKFLGDALKSITSAIGKSIENLLKGISSGLNSFKTGAVKGAAALIIVSGALWVTSKALQNFASVSWENVGKGIIAIGGLTLAATALGKISGQVITGALAIAILGASLIPAAYALNVFNDVDWSSLAKAGAALIGLGVAGGILGGMLPLMLMGAVGIAALGAAMIPMAIAMKMFNDVEWESLGKAGAALVGFGHVAAGFGLAAPLILAGALTIGAASTSLVAFAGSVLSINLAMKGLTTKPLQELTNTLLDVTSISTASLFGVASGIAAIAASMAALSIVGVGSSIAKLLGGDAVKDLERIAELADPLTTVNRAISQLSASIVELSNTLSSADFDSIGKLNDIDVKSLDRDVNQKLNTIAGAPQRYSEAPLNYKIAPQQPPIAQVMPPKKESVAQNVRINNLAGTKESNDSENGTDRYGNVQNSYYGGNSHSNDVYNNRLGADTRRVEMLLMRLIQLQETALQREASVVLDSQKVGSIIKKGYNN